MTATFTETQWASTPVFQNTGSFRQAVSGKVIQKMIVRRHS